MHAGKYAEEIAAGPIAVGEADPVGEAVDQCLSDGEFGALDVGFIGHRGRGAGRRVDFFEREF